MVDSIQLKEGAGARLLSMEVITSYSNERIKPFHKSIILDRFSSIEIKINVNRYTESIMEPTKLWRYALDGIFSFSIIPLKVWSLIGLFVSILSLFAFYIFLRH